MTAGRRKGAKIPYFCSPKPISVPSAAPVIIRRTVCPVPELFRLAGIFYPHSPIEMQPGHGAPWLTFRHFLV